MMGIDSDILNRLSALQLAPEAMQEVLSIIASCIEPQEARRRRDRDRKRGTIPRNIRGSPDGNSAETVTEIPPVHITTPPRQKPKKVSVYIDAGEIPENPSEEAKGFAEKAGWEGPKIDLEWQRFRDNGISKGRKHRGENGMNAAWRNWVRSPYQANGGSQVVQANQHPGGAYGASKDRFREAHADLKASIAADELREESGRQIVELLPTARRG